MNPDLFTNYELFAEKFLKITTPKSKLIPFEMNLYQIRLNKLILDLKAQKKPVRIIVLKARQMGISTYCSGNVYFECSTNFYTKGLVAAHDEKSTANLFTIAKRFYDLSPEQIKPMQRYSNAKELVFENPDSSSRGTNTGLMSSITIETGGKKTAGRSSTIQHLHISELAFWSNAKEALIGLMQSVHYEPGTSIIIESTANGMGGDGRVFYDMWNDAVAGKSDFIPFFIPWYQNPSYGYISSLGMRLTDEEKEMMAKFNLDRDQIYWRRLKIANDLQGDILKFHQEYPATADEAFIASGRPVFDQQRLIEKIELVKDVKSEPFGHAQVYRAPTDGGIYAIGADVAEGLSDGDYSTAFVIDKEMRQCAKIKCHLQPDKFADELIRLAKYYNNALLAPEINNHGWAVIQRIKDSGYSYVYTRQVHDEFAEKLLSKLGWHTNVKTKHLMLDDFIAAFRDDVIGIQDVELFREMITVTYEDNGDVVLNSKDLCVSACIAIQAYKHLPSDFKYSAVLPELEIKKPETFSERMKRLQTNDYSHFE